MLNNIAAILGVGGGAANSYESIATTTVGAGGASTVTFSSIPSTYKHLQIRVFGSSNRASSGDDLWIRYNSDSGTNYAIHGIYGLNSSVSVLSGANENKVVAQGALQTSAVSNTFGTGIIDILDYANTNKYKTTRILAGYDANTTAGIIAFDSGLWMNTSAINSITLLPWLGTAFNQYSHFALYGVKG